MGVVRGRVMSDCRSTTFAYNMARGLLATMANHNDWMNPLAIMGKRELRVTAPLRVWNWTRLPNN